MNSTTWSYDMFDNYPWIWWKSINESVDQSVHLSIFEFFRQQLPKNNSHKSPARGGQTPEFSLVESLLTLLKSEVNFLYNFQEFLHRINLLFPHQWKMKSGVFALLIQYTAHKTTVDRYLSLYKTIARRSGFIPILYTSLITDSA